MSIEIVNEPAPPVHATGKTFGHAHLKFVIEATGEVINEVWTDPMHENDRRERDDAKILDVGHRSE